MIYVSVLSVLDRAAFFLNDVNRAYFTNEVLIPPFTTAYDDLKEELYDYNIPITNQTSGPILVPIGVIDIGGTTGPPLPNNLVVPMELYERADGSENDFIRMEPSRFLPKTGRQTSNLTYWSFQNQMILFVGATEPRQVKIDYVADNLFAADEISDQINLFNAKSFLSYRTAALAAEYLGENSSRAQALNSNAERSMDSLLNTSIKNQQNMPVRRRPFRRQSFNGFV